MACGMHFVGGVSAFVPPWLRRGGGWAGDFEIPSRALFCAGAAFVLAAMDAPGGEARLWDPDATAGTARGYRTARGRGAAGAVRCRQHTFRAM